MTIFHADLTFSCWTPCKSFRKFSINFSFDRHGQDRPRKGSVKVKFIEKGKELEEEDKEAVKTQCQFFHKFPIDVALKKAFLEAVEDEREDHEAVMDES